MGIWTDGAGFFYEGDMRHGDREATAAEIAAWDAARAPRPGTISDRQFFQGLALQSFITEAEALEAVKTGVLPAALETIVAGIADPAAQFAARMILSGATMFERDHPLVASVGAALGLNEAQIDALFVAAAGLTA